MKTLAEIMARKAEIRSLLESGEKCDLAVLETELRELDAAQKEIEKRQVILSGISNGSIIGRSIELPSEQRSMEGMSKEEIAASSEYRSAWLKTLQGKSLSEVEQRAYSTASGAGAEVVPTVTSSKIIAKVYQIAPVLEHMPNLFHVPGNLKWAAEDTNVDAAIHTENGTITPAADTLKDITLSAYEVTKAIRVSRTVATMAIDAFEAFIVQLLAENLARKLEALVFSGTGSSQPTGLSKAGSGTSGAYVEGTDQISITNANAVSEADVLKFYSMVGNYPGAKAYMSKATFLDYFYPIMNNAKNISVKYVNGQFYIMDAPVFFTNTLGKGIGYMASMDQMVGNFAEDINVRKSMESGFLNNSVDYLAVCAFDCKPITGVSAFAKFVKAQS